MKEGCLGDLPLFFLNLGFCEVKWLSRGFWDLLEHRGFEITINGWSGGEVEEEETRIREEREDNDDDNRPREGK